MCPKTKDLQVAKAEQNTTTQVVNETMSTATPTRLSFEILEKVAGEIMSKVPGIVSVTYNIAPKPPQRSRSPKIS
jgi:GMP synthase PP-ATPase subunit